MLVETIRGAVNALRQNKDLPDGWLSEEYVRFASPVSPDRWVWLMLCNVHNFKNYRTALHASKPDGKRFFTNKDGTSWSWKTLQYIYKQDLERNPKVQQTALQKASVEDLDKLTCMRVHLAKHVFEYSTVSFALALIAEQMGVLEELTKDAESFGPSQRSAKLTSSVGYLRGISEIVNASPFILEQISLAEFLVMGHNVFHRMLNKNAFLVLDGNNACDFPSMRQSAINDEIEKVKKDVKYLDDGIYAQELLEVYIMHRIYCNYRKMSDPSQCHTQI
jgi:hypothetical protein